MTASFSSLPRILACGWELSPEAVTEDSPPGDDAAFGTAVHELALHPDGLDVDEVALRHGQSAAELQSYVGPVRQKLGDLSEWPETECAWALEPVTGQARFLGSWISRNYVTEPGEIPGTTDMHWFEGETLVVADLKTGHANYVSKPSDNAQLLAGAAAICAHHKFSGPVRLELWFARPGGVWVEHAEVSAIELMLFRDKLARHMTKAVSGSLSPRPGDHCKYCPARRACPATTALAEAMVGVDKHRFSDIILSQAHAEWLVDRLALAKKVTDSVEEALKRYADENGGIACSDGKVWKAVQSKRTGLNTEAVKARLGADYAAFTTTHEYKSYRKVKA